MFKDIIIGQYIPGKSVLHRMDARVKILLTLAFIVVLFVINHPVSYVVFTVFTIALILMSRIPIRFLLKGLKPMLFILLFTAVINLFMTPGDPLWSVRLFGWTLSITQQGVVSGILMLLRLLYLVVGTTILTLTTSPLQLTDGIEMLLSPFQKIKVPAHEIAMMMTIAIRFIPTLAEETDKIMKAQMARGADFETGNLVQRAKAMVPLLVPLFISAFRRADELATAMEARCYRGGKNRTKMKQMRMTMLDAWAAIVFVGCTGILIAIEIIM